MNRTGNLVLPAHNSPNWCGHISSVVFKKTTTYHLQRLKTCQFFFCKHLSKAHGSIACCRRETSVSNWQNSGFIMGDSNEQNHFVIHSVGDYKLIRNPSPSPSLRSVLHFLSLVGFFPWSQSKSWIFLVAQAVIKKQFPHCRDISAVFLEFTHCTSPSAQVWGCRAALGVFIVASWWLKRHLESETPWVYTECARYSSWNDDSSTAPSKSEGRKERELILRAGARDLGGMHVPIQLSGDESHRTRWSGGCSSRVLTKSPGSRGGAVNASRRLLSVWKKATGSVHIFLKTKSQPSANLRRLEPICDPPTTRSATLREQQFWCTFCLQNWAHILVQELGGVYCFLLCKYLV